MKYTSFRIENFKGISSLEFDLTKRGRSRTTALVGLNESGKTTVLEALFFFYDNVIDVDEPQLQRGVVGDVHELIPKRRLSNFTDETVLEAVLELDVDDQEAFRAACRDEGFEVVTEIPKRIAIQQTYEFVGSKHHHKLVEWDLEVTGRISVKQPAGTVITPETVTHIERVLTEEDSAWSAGLRALSDRMPALLYYPNFLFKFPDRIFLEEHPNEGDEQKFYRKLIQDVLDSLDEELTITDHLLARAKSQDLADADALESVINKMSDRITSVVFGSDRSPFGGRNPVRTQVRVRPPTLDPGTKKFFVSLRLRDGSDSFGVNERSLGFRWFFTFRLFTQFRVHRDSAAPPPVFLLDEPASNLHQSAQQRLVEGFGALVRESGCSIIYSTHSHHMLSTDWLDDTFIVRNRGLDYDSDWKFDQGMTDIQVTRYRRFVSENPSSRSYFQPVLDLLEYKPSDLEAVGSVVMLEGKGDFYAVHYMLRVGLKKKYPKLRLLPGGGAGSLDVAIQLYFAWGRRFAVILDSDRAGHKARERYRTKFGPIVEHRLHTLNDLVGTEGRTRIEDLFTEHEQLAFALIAKPDAKKATKKLIAEGVQRALLSRTRIPLSRATQARFRRLAESMLALVDEA